MNPIMLVIATRPEGIKMAPVYFALKEANIPVYVCSTTQHDTLLDEVFSLFSFRPDIELGIMQPNQNLFHITTAALRRLEAIYRDIKPTVVLIQGDTTSVMAAALGAFYAHIPVGHIEAGLRTYDIYAPYPEEMNRRVISLIAQYNFAPTALAASHLFAEGKGAKSVFCTGNSVVDSLRIIQSKIDKGILPIDPDIERIVASCTIENQKIVLLTAHRRESFNGGIERILSAMKKFALTHTNVCIIYPYHPNPTVLKAIETVNVKEIENIYMIKPVTYENLVYLLNAAHCIATDSGGIQEEAVSLGKPLLVLREKTERTEAIWEGLAQIVGTNEQLIIKSLERLISQDRTDGPISSIYGDGFAAQRIVQILKNSVSTSTVRQPMSSISTIRASQGII